MNSKTNAKDEPMENGAERIRSFSELYERHADGINAEHQKLRDEAVAACHFEHDEFLVWKEDPNDKHSAWYVVLPTSTTVGSGDLLSFNAHFDDEVDEARARFVAVACTRALRGLLNPHDDQSKQWQAGFAAGVDSVATQPPQDERGQGMISELLFDFGGFLTCSERRWVFSSHDDASPMVDAIREFAVKRGIDLNAEPAQPVALSTLTDGQIDEGMDKSIMSAHEITAFGAGVRWAEKKHRALAASAPAQQTMQTFELLGIVQTAMSQANVIIKAEGDKGDLSQAMKDLPLTLRVIETALSTPPQPVAAEVAKDAARYRFLRMDAGIRNERPFIAISSAGGISQWIGFHADKKIDSAMAGTGSDESAKENGNGL